MIRRHVPAPWSSSGTDDLTVDGRIGSALYDIATALVALYKAQGFYVVVETVLPHLCVDCDAGALLGQLQQAGPRECRRRGRDRRRRGSVRQLLCRRLHLTAAGQDRKTVLYQAALPALLTSPPRARATMPAGVVRPVRHATLSGMTKAIGGSGSSYEYAPTADDANAVSVHRAGTVLTAEYYRSGVWTVLFGFDAGSAPALVPAIYSQAAGVQRTLSNTVGEVIS